jgi:hypothetical protein
MNPDRGEEISMLRFTRNVRQQRAAPIHRLGPVIHAPSVVPVVLA